MGKDRQDLSEAGRALGPLAEIMRQVKEGELTPEQLQAIVEHRIPFNFRYEIFKVTVDCSMSLKQLLEACNLRKKRQDNHYNSLAHFSLKGFGKQEIELALVHLGWHSQTIQVHQQLSFNGLKAARIEHLLAFGANFPNIPEKENAPILALGSSYCADDLGRQAYPGLERHYQGERDFHIPCEDPDNLPGWPAYYRFLAIRK